jgi:hypothetical protein
MANSRKKLNGGVRINPNTDALIDDGDINVDSSDNKLKVRLNGATKTVATEDQLTAGSGTVGGPETIHLIKAATDGATNFTITSIDDILPDFEGSDTLTATAEVPTSGSEALLSNDDDHAVYKYSSTAGSQYDAFGTNLNIPRYIRGKDVVLQFKYRTADTSGASADGDYMIWVWDKTNGVNETTTSTGSISAGTAITLGDTTGMAVGDKIWVGETGGTAQVTEAHITEITSGTQIKISETVNLSSGDRFVTGILTDVLTTLDAADDDTNKTGNDFKVVFNVPSTCAEVTLLFQQLTSQTDSFLYVDNILVSSEVVKRIFAKNKAEHFKARIHAGYGSSAAFIPYFSIEDSNTISKYGTLVNDSTDGLKFTASVRCKVHATYTNNSDASGADAWGFTLNSSALGANLIDTADTLGYVEAQITGFRDQASVSIIMEAGDILRPHNSSAFTPNNSSSVYFNMVVEPEVNDVVVVESTDSVISEGTSYTPSNTQGFGIITGKSIKWRRVGSYLEIDALFTAGTTTASEAQFELPNGLQIATTGSSSPIVCGVASQSNASAASPVNVLYTQGDSYLNFGNATSGSVTKITPDTGSASFISGSDISFFAKVPIAGWDANPKPLLAFPTITYGQEPEYHSTGNNLITNFWDADADVYTFDITLIPLTGSSLLEWNDTTQTRLVAKKRVKLHVTLTSGADIGGDLFIYDSSGNIIDHYQEKVAGGYFGSVRAHIILDAGDYIYFRQDNPTTNRNALLNILAEPFEGQVNQAAIIAQPVAYCRFDSASTRVTVGSNTTVTLDVLDGDIAAVGVTLSSNDFTLPAGKYELDYSFYMWASGTGYTVGNCQIYNVTKDKVEHYGTAAGGDGSNGGTYAPSTGSTMVIITQDTTFRIRANNLNNSGSHALFVGDGLSNSDKGYVKITRKK